MPAFCSLLLPSYYSNNFASLVVGCEIVSSCCCLLWLLSVSFCLLSAVLPLWWKKKSMHCCMGRAHLVWDIHTALNPSLTGSPTLSPSLTGSVLRYCMRTWHSTPTYSKLSCPCCSEYLLFGNSTVWRFCEGCPKNSWKALLVNCVPHLPTIHLVLSTVWSNIYFCAHCN